MQLSHLLLLHWHGHKKYISSAFSIFSLFLLTMYMYVKPAASFQTNPHSHTFTFYTALYKDYLKIIFLLFDELIQNYSILVSAVIVSIKKAMFIVCYRCIISQCKVTSRYLRTVQYTYAHYSIVPLFPPFPSPTRISNQCPMPQNKKEKINSNYT